MAKLQADDGAWLGFDSRNGRMLAGEGDGDAMAGLVKPGDTVIVESCPQVPFRASRMFVHLPVASAFLIHAIRVGVRENLVSCAPIPADAFATRMDALAEVDRMFARDGVVTIKVDEKAMALLGSPLVLPLAFPGTILALHVENVGDVPLRFLAGMLGRSERS